MADNSNLESGILFHLLVINFQLTAMIHLGKVVNPVTKKAERDLDEAKSAIDMLAMIAEKTKGNLTPEEDRLLQQTLTDLRLNYIYEKSQPEHEKTGETDRETNTDSEIRKNDKTT